MKLIELIVVHETVLENRIEPVQALLTTHIENHLPKVFDLLEVLVSESMNSTGNHVTISRVTLEHRGILSTDEVEKFSTKVLKDFEIAVTDLLEVKSNIIEKRSAKIKLL